MLIHAFPRPIQRLTNFQCHNIKSFSRLRPIGCTLTVRTFSRSQKLALQLRGRLAAKGPLHQSKIAPYESASEKLSRNADPILLYQAHNNLPFTLGCYSIGFFLITCAIINNHTKHAAETANVAPWVKVGVAVGQCAMVAFGGYILLKPQNLIKSIRSVPFKDPGARSVQLQIERSKTIPFLRPKTYTVPSRDITMSAPLFRGPEEQVKAEIKELQRQEREYLQTNKDISPYTWPFRILGHWTYLFFYGTKRAFTSGDIINFHVKGRNFPWKMDTDLAWALEGGRSLDEIVRIKEV